MLNKSLKDIELFLKSSNFYKGIRLTFAAVTPLTILFALDYTLFAPAIMMGVLINAPGDIPGSLQRKINTILISTGLTMLVTTIILFLKPYFFVLFAALAVISFLVSLLSVYGFRASLVSLSGLLSMALAFAVQEETVRGILTHVALLGVGGLWYLLVSLTFQKLAPKKDNNQLLSDTLSLIGNYLKLRAKLLNEREERESLIQQTLVLQTQINGKHETLREALLTRRKRSGRSHVDEKHMLIFISTVNIFELIEAKHLDYHEVDRLFGDKKQYLNASINLNNVLGDQLITLSELIIQNKKLPTKDTLLNALAEANQAITSYIEDVKFPTAREGSLLLKNLYDYQKLLLEEIRAVRRVMANVKGAPKISLKRLDGSPFLTLQEYDISILFQNLSFNSNLFRHALRFTVAFVFAFVLGTYLDIQNTYWILMSIVVIMRPNYGLTKERSKDRIVGTLIGAAVAMSIVLLTQNIIIYGILAIVSLTLAFALVQQNYKSSAAFITINVVFVYSLINPNNIEIIQYRVLDTIIGATIAIVANYVLWPSWEAYNFREVLLNAIKKNQHYLLATKDLYHDKDQYQLSHKLARKEAFLAISNLNAAFQRLTQDPKSKQKEYQLIYELVTLNQTIVSAIASIGSFILNHKTTPASKEFDLLILKIANNLELCCTELTVLPAVEQINTESIKDAEEFLLKTFQDLSNERDQNIQKGITELSTEALHHLQEAYLIYNQIIWLKSLSENLKKVTTKYVKVL